MYVVIKIIIASSQLHKIWNMFPAGITITPTIWRNFSNKISKIPESCYNSWRQGIDYSVLLGSGKLYQFSVRSSDLFVLSSACVQYGGVQLGLGLNAAGISLHKLIVLQWALMKICHRENYFQWFIWKGKFGVGADACLLNCGQIPRFI